MRELSLFTDEELDEDRADFLTLCSDTIRVTRNATPDDVEWVPHVMDPVTLHYPAPGKVVIYEGPARIQVKVDVNSNVVETTAGDREWTYLTAQMQFPVDTPTDHERYVSGDVGDIRPDNVAEALLCPFDTTIVGRVFNIQGIYHKSQATYRRFRAREVIS